jgi:hypothetical protein
LAACARPEVAGNIEPPGRDRAEGEEQGLKKHFPALAKRRSLYARRPVESAFRRQAMIFIHRLGIVFYWVGYVLAILFAIVSLLIALNGLISGGAISEASVYAVLSVVCWIWGRLMKYILTDM